MKIGVIGSGNVGGALGKRWAQNGHTVTFSSRDSNSPEMKQLVNEAGTSAQTGTPQQAAESEVVLFATPWPATKEAVLSAGSLKGKIVIDATNPMLPDLSALEIGTTTSAGEMMAEWTKGAKVVKAFNTVGANIMADPRFGDRKPSLFYCGDDAGAKKTVAGLIAELGFTPLDAGPLTQARLLEPMAMLWVSMALKYGYGRDMAFDLLRRG